MRSLALLSVLILSLSCALGDIGPWGTLLYEGQAVTSKGDSQNLVIEPQRVGDNTQVWRWEDGVIVSKANPSLVFDVKASRLAPNTPVIAYPRHNGKNQWFNISSNFVVSLLASSYYLKIKTGTTEVVVDYTFSPSCPPPFKFVEPLIGPVSCSSHGDPHITCWSKTIIDYQFVGTVILARFNGHLIQTQQGSCGANVPFNVTCNKGVVVKPAGTNSTIQVQWNGIVYINGVQTTIVGSLNVSSTFSIKKQGAARYVVYLPGGYVSTQDYNFYVTVTFGYLEPSLCTCSAEVEQHTYGLSHTVANQTESSYTYTPTDPFVYDPTYVPSYGPVNPSADAISACSPLKSGSLWSQCKNIVLPDPYYQNCLLDVTLTGDVQQADSNIAAYSVHCSEVNSKSDNPVPIVLPTTGATSTTSLGANNTQLWNFTLSFTIQARNALGDPRTNGGDNFSIEQLSGPVPLTYTVVDLNNGWYVVTYAPTVTGQFVIAIKLNGNINVAEGPYTLNVTSGGNIIIGGLALTYKGLGLNVTLEPLIVGEKRQQWTLTGNFVYNKFATTQVLDAKDGSTRVNNNLITWTKKTPNELNQQWTISTAPTKTGLRSLMPVTNYYAKPSGLNPNVVFLDYTTTPQAFYYI